MPEHWCKEHRVVWFKKGKMKGYAHPIIDDEGEPTGEWCNEPEKREKPIEIQPTMSKDDWAEKDKITRKSIERQTSLNAAIELAKIKGTDDTDRVLATAKRFEAYLEGKEIPVKQSRLVEEAKRLGAVEEADE